MSVHAIVDDLAEARDAVAAGASVVRLAPGLDTGATIAAGRGLRRLGTPFYVVDDLDAARELGADGLHLEQHPERAAAARALGLRFGALAGTLDGLAAVATYLDVEVDPVRSALDGDWLPELAAICDAAPAPVIVRGSLDAETAAACIAAGAAGVAVAGSAADRALRASVARALASRGAARSPQSRSRRQR